MLAGWTEVKSLLVNRGLSAQSVIIGSNYWIKAIDSTFEIECVIPTDTTLSSDSLDFVTNFLPNANKVPQSPVIVNSTPPYGAKTININGVIHNLYARYIGFQQSLTSGSNVISYTSTYPWGKVLGVEVINCEALDTADFKVYDTSTGTYSGVANKLLNQFSFSCNMPKDFYLRMAEFDADLYAGMIIQITYNSISAKTLGINLILNQVV